MKISKKLFVLPFLVFAMASCGKTPEDDSKDKEKDKPAEKTKVTIPQLFSGETGTTPLENFIYDGTEKHVHLEGVVSEKVEVKDTSVFSATNAGTYTVEIALKDSSKNCWSDKTTANKTLNWEIEPVNIAGHSDGYRIVVGGVAAGSSDTTPYYNKTIADTPATLAFQFKLLNPMIEEYEWVDFPYATFDVTSSNALIDNGKLVITDTSAQVGITVGSSNPNYAFSQGYNLRFYEVKTLTFVPGSAVGSDGETSLRNSFWQEITTTYEDYVLSMSCAGSGFAVSKMFSAPLTVKFKLDVSNVTLWSQSISVYFSKNTDFAHTTGDVTISRWIDEDSYDYANDYVIFNFSSMSFDGEPYYFQSWFGGSGGGSIKIKEIVIEYKSPIC